MNMEVYLIRSGFFTSMRAGRGSVYLNVNNTTTAFFFPVTLDKWMMNRWKMTSPPPDRFQKELKGLKVIFTGKTNSRKYQIFGISNKPISKVSFDLKEGAKKIPTKVVEHMQKSKCSNNSAGTMTDHLHRVQGEI
jgi:hypothetical protein